MSFQIKIDFLFFSFNIYLVTINQLKMINLAPRGIRATCVPTSLCFVTESCYQDVDHLIQTEQARYRRGDGVVTTSFLGEEKNVFGYKFTKLTDITPGTRRLYSIQKELGQGTYVITIPRHMLVLKDGQFFDLCTTNPNSIVHHVWHVAKA
jgi:hypothetical protein